MSKEIKQIIESITGYPLTSENGMDIMEIEAVEIKIKQKFPSVLKEFYALAGNIDMLMTSFQNFIEPYLLGNKIVFLEENQGVCFWAIDKSEVENAEANVYVATDLETENVEWYPENVTLKKFLEIIMYYQCAQGGYEFGASVEESDFENRKTYTDFLIHTTLGYKKVVEHNGLVIYQNNGKLIWHFTDEDGNLMDAIFSSARNEAEMKELELKGFKEL